MAIVKTSKAPDNSSFALIGVVFTKTKLVPKDIVVEKITIEKEFGFLTSKLFR